MIEYPSIINSSKAPRQPCVAFEKIDGSNIRVKYTQKNGFELFGSRTQLIDHNHPHLGDVCGIFFIDFAEPLTKIFKKEFPNEREIIVFGEYYGDNSFAGVHQLDEPHYFSMFDVMTVRKGQTSFVKPREFVKLFDGVVRTPKVVYEGNLNEELIADVRNGIYGDNEGVVCKGNVTNGAYRGKVWMCKIKTNAYIERLKNRFGKEWEKYGE